MKKSKSKVIKKENNSKKSLVFLLVGMLLVLFLLDFLLARYMSPRQIDDVTPQIFCEKNYIDKSDTLMVVPMYGGVSIAGNKTWCKEILALNKTLGMHGVFHTYREFFETRNENYINLGIEEFEKCFGFRPTIFEAPQVALSLKNVRTLKNMNFTIRNYGYQMTHKVYHCSNTGKYSNFFIDLF